MIEELKRQYDEAQAAVEAATKHRMICGVNLRGAVIVQCETKLAERGITPGVKVKRGDLVGIYTGCTTTRWDHHIPMINVMAIKKDGTAHATKSVWGFHDAKPEDIEVAE